MSVSTRVVDHEGMVEIDIQGRFDFSVQKDFRAAYRDCPPSMNYRVNLAEVEYMDSAALGMLLLLRQHAGDTRECVTLLRPQEAVNKVLRVANFDRIFQID